MIRSLRGQLQAVGGAAAVARRGVRTHIGLLDAFASADADGLASGAIHEVLADPKGGGSVDAFALLLASAVATSRSGGWVVWSDPGRTLYPPAMKRSGVALERLLLLRPRSPQEELWAIAECMRCAGVAATVARVERVTPVQARRLQLAVEQGGGVGVLVRPDDARSANYAAATRWRVSSLSSSETAQRWQVELTYGHGGRVGQRFVLEVDRETGGAVATTGTAAVALSDGTSAATAAAENPVRRPADLAGGLRASQVAQRSSA
jgi:hypothetical protein